MDSKEKLILDAARVLFFQYGFKKTSIDEIAEAAGIGKGTVYNYFKNKEDLFIQCSEKTKKKMERQLDEETKHLTRADDKMIQMAVTRVRFVQQITSEYAMSQKIQEELMNIGIRLNEDVPEHIEKTISLIQEGVDQNIFKDGNQFKNAKLINQISIMFMARWVKIDLEESEKEVREVFELIFNGLRK